MARDPGSVWKPLPEAGAPDGYAKSQFIFHSTGTMASAAANWAYFNRENVVVESTFIVGWGPDDPTLQIMDSTDNADANGSANRRAISVEVVGDGVGPYNDWQISECIRLGLWAREEHDILPRIISSEPEGGYGWHIMFGAPGPWTSVRGKVCPGARRIQQLRDAIFPAIFAGTPMEDDMPEYPDWSKAGRESLLLDIETYVLRKPDVLTAIATAVWEHKTSGRETQAQDRLTGIDMTVGATRGEVVRLVTEGGVDEEKMAAALAPQLLRALPAAGVGLTEEQVQAALREVLRTGTGPA